MKVRNGEWMLYPGFEIFVPKEVYFEKVVNNKLVLTAPTTKINHRGDTLGGVVLTVEITTPQPGVIRVRSYHFKGLIKEEPAFDLNIKNDTIRYDSNEEELVVYSGDLKLVIDKVNWEMKYYRNETLLTQSGYRDLGYVKKDWQGLAYDTPTYENSFMQQRLRLTVGELVYGFGEKFTNFVKNGQTVKVWNEDGGTSSEQSYKNIPFYITNRGYGVFVNHPEKVEFEVSTEDVKRVGFSVHGEVLDYFVIDGPNMLDVLEKYTDITGKPGLPKPWTYGLWLSTSFTTNYDEETVMSFINGMRERNIPLEVFHFDCFWMKDFHWSNFLWNDNTFKDPKGMLKRIKDLGIKISVWINPYIAQESELFNEGMEKGYFIKRHDGRVWQWDMWQPGMAIVDFTNPEAYRWYQEKLGALVDMGVDTFKTDFGERIPTDVKYFDNSDPFKMHNYYAYIYNKNVYEILEEKRGKGDAFLFARSATVGGQKFPVHWGGDCWSDYESMAESLRGGLSLNMSGFGFWSHDIGGFEASSTADVYKRWCQFGLLSSHSRLHGSTSYRVPWAYDEEAVDVLRHFTNLKMQLMPYIYSISVLASTRGIPTMRSMVMEFNEDKTTHYLDKQYMFGDALVVAPILNDQGLGEIYLPKGVWTDLQTKEKVEGAKWHEATYDYFSLPLFVKENTILPIGNNKEIPTYNYAKDVNLEVYQLVNNQLANRIVFDENGILSLEVSIVKKDQEIVVEYQAKHPFKLTFINLEVTSDQLKVDYQNNHSTISVDNVKNNKLVLKIK